jgi:antitoxin (DNA-binding transcriptional repressor) of toxin-antitoxin stability system
LAGSTNPRERATLVGRLGALGSGDVAQVDIAEAAAELSALADRAAAGEEVVLARAGRPVARITALAEIAPATKKPRRPGIARHWVLDHDALMAPTDPEDLDAAEGLHTDALGVTLSDRV